MDILKDLQNMIDRSSAFAKRNEIELRGNGRDSGNVYIIPEIELFTFLQLLIVLMEIMLQRSVTTMKKRLRCLMTTWKRKLKQ